mgnify:CR=1 FL=1
MRLVPDMKDKIKKKKTQLVQQVKRMKAEKVIQNYFKNNSTNIITKFNEKIKPCMEAVKIYTKMLSQSKKYHDCYVKRGRK